MPVGEVVGHVLVEIVLEFFIKGPGFVIARMIRPNVDPDGAWSIITGLLFWALLGGLVYGTYRVIAA